MSDPRLMLIIASTRPGRIGLPVAEWMIREVEEHGGFDLEVADLAQEGLPLLDEPHHPRLQDYVHDHTKRWSAKVAAADAFVFVMPEYNFSYNAALKNALDFVMHEWAHKPVGLCSYGGVSAGTRAAAAIRPTLGALRLVPVGMAVSIPFVAQFLKDGVIEPNELMHESASAMLTEIRTMAVALAGIRGRTGLE